MADRGMKKWLPFSSLVEQNEYLSRMIYEKYKIEKPLIFEDQAEKINNILKGYDYVSPLKMDVFYDGYVYHIKDKITFIDKNKKLVYFTNFTLPLKNILDIEDNTFVSVI